MLLVAAGGLMTTAIPVRASDDLKRASELAIEMSARWFFCTVSAESLWLPAALSDRTS